MNESTEIGAYETKTRLAEYLREVQAGARFTITQRGRPVATLVPYKIPSEQARPLAVEQMKAFMRAQSTLRGASIKQLIEDGRD